MASAPLAAGRRLARLLGGHARTVSSSASEGVSAAAAAAYARDGAVLLKGLLSAAEVETLAGGICANMAAPGPLAGTASRNSDP